MQTFVKLTLLFTILFIWVGPVSAQDDSDWATFTSADGKFSFQHPATWNVSEFSGGDDAPNLIYVAIEAIDSDENRLFYAEGAVLNASKTEASPFAGPRLSDSAEAIVDYISFADRYVDFQPQEGWGDIMLLERDDAPTVAYVCGCEDYRTFHFAVALGNGNYFALKNVYIYPDYDLDMARETVIDVLHTMTYEQQTVYTYLDFPAPVVEDAPVFWRISSEQDFVLRGSAIDQADNIYVFHHFNEPERRQALVVLDADGQVLRILHHPEMAGNDMAIGADGSIWITDGSIHHFTSEGEFIETLTHPEANFEFVVDYSGFAQIAIDSDNNLIALNTGGTASVVIFSPDGEPLNTFEVPFASSPSGNYDWLAVLDGLIPSLDVTDEQIIYVHNPNNRHVHAYDREGNEIDTDLTLQLASVFPQGTTEIPFIEHGVHYFTYGADGLFYVVGSAPDKPEGIYIYDKTGAELGFVAHSDIVFEGTSSSQFYVLSDGSVITIHSNDIRRRQAIH